MAKEPNFVFVFARCNLRLTSVTACGNLSQCQRLAGGYIFFYWISDHPPRHVHVYRNGKLVVKWDLDNRRAMRGRISRRILKLIEELESEGML
jgi:hypothetical protein